MQQLDTATNLFGNAGGMMQHQQRDARTSGFDGNQTTDLLQLQKDCSNLNKAQLRNAKNLQDLVNIKVHNVEKKLSSTQGGGFKAKMDMAFDPIQAMQRVPILADSRFLGNQAVTGGTNSKQRTYFKQARPQRNLALELKSTGQRSGYDRPQLFSSAASTATGANARQSMFTANSKTTKGVDLNHFEHLFSATASNINRDDMATTGQMHDLRSNLFSSGDAGQPLSPAEPNQQPITPQMAYAEAEMEEEASNMHDKEGADPIKALKALFNKKKINRHLALDTNHVINKYKQKEKNRTQATNTRQTTARQYYSQQAGRAQTRDQRLPGEEMTSTDYAVLSTDPRDEQVFSGTAKFYDGGKVFREDEQRAPFGQTAGFADAHPASYRSEPHLMKELNVKQRLDNLRKLFAEDDENTQVSEIQKQWERQDQPRQSLPAPALNSDRQHPKSLFRQSLRKKFTDVPKEEKEDLQTFLVKKISQAQARSDPLSLPMLEAEKRQLQAKGLAQLKYKASTLTNIAEFKHLGQDHIENQYIDRQFREQTDYHFDKYEFNQIKIQGKMANQNRFGVTHNVQTSLINTNMFEQLQELIPTTLESSMHTNPVPSQRQPKSKRKEKPKNFVQEQLLKIERINREASRFVVAEKPVKPQLPRGLSNQKYGYADIKAPKEYDPIFQQEAWETPLMEDNSVQIQPQKTKQEVMQVTNLFQDINRSPMMDGPSPATQSVMPAQNLDQTLENPEQKADTLGSQNAINGPETNPTDPEVVAVLVEKPQIRQDVESILKNLNQDSKVKQRRYGSPDFEKTYLSDTEIYSKNPFKKAAKAATHRGGGFKVVGTGTGTEAGSALDQAALLSSYRQKRGMEQILLKSKDPEQLMHGNNFGHFCPKRFNRYPRFTIFYDRNKLADDNQDQYHFENTVSLGPQFLSYLMIKNEDLEPIEEAEGAEMVTGEAAAREIRDQPHQPANFLPSQAYAGSSKGESVILPAGPPTGPEDSIQTWNPTSKNGQIQNYDPFEKVVLVKGIDNQILTSFRTLKRENNTVSDTFKVVHQKFKPQKDKGQYMHKMARQNADRLHLYPHTDTEDYLEQAQAEMLAASFLRHAEQQQYMALAGQGESVEINQDIHHSGGRAGSLKRSSMDNKTTPHHRDVLGADARAESSMAAGGPGEKQDSPRKDEDTVFDKLEENLELNRYNESQNSTTDKLNLKAMAIFENTSKIEAQAQELLQHKEKAGKTFDRAKHSHPDKRLQKHEIEVMVLSKIDAFKNAFPGRGNITELSTGTIQRGSQLRKQAVSLPQGVGQPRAHTKPGEESSVQTSKKATGEQFGSPSGPRRAASRGQQSSIENMSGPLSEAAAQPDQLSLLGRKYGKDFRIPELPPILQDLLLHTELQPSGATSGANLASRSPKGSYGLPAPLFGASQAQPVGQAAGGTQYKIKKFIDDIYQKEMKYRYQKQYVREDFLHTKNVIFDLSKYHRLRPRRDLIDQRIEEEEEEDRPMMPNPESLPNVLGFQAGGFAAITPRDMDENENHNERVMRALEEANTYRLSPDLGPSQMMEPSYRELTARNQKGIPGDASPGSPNSRAGGNTKLAQKGASSEIHDYKPSDPGAHGFGAQEFNARIIRRS